MKTKRALTVVVALILAIAIQTSVFGRFRVGSIAPDLVLVVVILITLQLAPSPALVVAFLSGATLDALSSDALGLRALAYTAVAYAALRTRDRADAGPVAAAVWIGVLSLFGILLLVVVGTLFGQIDMTGSQLVRRVVVVPLLNLTLAFLLIPLIERVQRPARRFV